MRNMKINLSSCSYDIIIEEGALERIANYVKEVYKKEKIFIISDDKVAPIYLSKVQSALESDYIVDSVVIPNGEESKCIEKYIYVCEALINKGIKRNHLLLALGGGVIGDLTGFVASSLYRGIPYIGVPTSLLSQMDSSIGGKTGIDFAGRKNILGAFKQPLRVIIDPNTLDTLDDREFNNGMGELIKHGAIGNSTLLKMLESKPKINEDVIFESLSVKKRVVELDEFDQGERMTLNFGHTFGHAIELKYGYKHGEAVAIGMLMAAKMGADLKVTPEFIYDYLKDILVKYNLPVIEYDYKEYLTDVLYDKKNLAGVINFIFLDKLGSCVIYPITEDKLKEIK